MATKGPPQNPLVTEERTNSSDSGLCGKRSKRLLIGVVGHLRHLEIFIRVRTIIETFFPL